MKDVKSVTSISNGNIPIKPQKKKIVKFVPKPRVWKLNDEETTRLFNHEMAARMMMLLKLMPSRRSGY